MLILPPGHGLQVARRQRLGGRDRRILGGVVGAAVVALIVIVIVGVTGSGGTTQRNCVNITFASSLGAQQISGCGGEARSLCAGVGRPGGYAGTIGRLLAQDCRKHGIPVG